MTSRLFILFLSMSMSYFNFGSASLSKDVHVPTSGSGSGALEFGITRSLVDGSLKSDLLTELKTLFSINAFVETGTNIGSTTLNAAKLFDEVHTVELDESLYYRAVERLKPWNHVRLHLGSSEEILKRVLPSVEGRILFYLDGHYSGQGTAFGTMSTPVIHELEAIADSNKRDSVILVDDIRLFQNAFFSAKTKELNCGFETYPDLGELVDAILSINPNYQICFLGDALLAFPSDDSVFISAVTRACALHRLEHLCDDLTQQDLLDNDQTIAKAKRSEKTEMAIYYQTYSPFELEYGFRCYASLWYALTLREDGQEEQACALLKKAAESSDSNWSLSRSWF